MNAKKCKMLRKMARNFSVGMPTIAYKPWQPPQFALSINGGVQSIIKVQPGIPCEVDPMSTRGYYLALKKATS